jgi:hypothetical protein
MSSKGQRPGIGVDYKGGPVIDPTKNVLDLVQALKEMLSELRNADNTYQNHMREAETRRVNDLASQKDKYDLELAKILRANQDAASTLLATQLKEVKTDLQTELRSLNEFRWQSGGKAMGSRDIVLGIATALTLLIALAALFIHR